MISELLVSVVTKIQIKIGKIWLRFFISVSALTILINFISVLLIIFFCDQRPFYYAILEETNFHVYFLGQCRP